MKFAPGLLILFLSSAVRAETVQVPDQCIGKKAPCVVRTEDNQFEFEWHGARIKMLKQTILKISSDTKQGIELIEGRVQALAKQPGLSFHGAELPKGLLFISRENQNLSFLQFPQFWLTSYRIESGKPAQRESSVFATKKDFVEFTRHYFLSMKAYNKFLKSSESVWKKQFIHENASQTKVLTRTIASIEKKRAYEESLKRREEENSKKVRNDFFYRTFYR